MADLLRISRVAHVELVKTFVPNEQQVAVAECNDIVGVDSSEVRQFFQIQWIGFVKNFQPIIAKEQMLIGNRKSKRPLHFVRFEQGSVGQLFDADNIQLIDRAIASGAVVYGNISVIVIAHYWIAA